MDNELTYKGFEDIPVHNFYKIVEESDVRWFFKGYYKGKEIELSEDDEITLLDRYKKVYDDRINYTNDVKSKEYYRKLIDISKLETKLFRMQNSFDVLTLLDVDAKYSIEFIEYFEQEGYKFNGKVIDLETKIEYLKWLKGKIKGFNTKVKAKKLEYKDVLEPKKIEGATAKFDLVKEKIILEEALSRVIDIYTCPLIEWSAIIIRAEEKARIQKAHTEKIKNKRR